MHVPPLPQLAAVDPDLAELIEAESQRQHDKLRMIPSENYVSTAVLEACGTVLNNKYSEGYAGKRYYEGQQFIDPIEELAVARARGPVRGRARQRPAVLGLAREPGRLPGLHEPGRHLPVAGAGPRRAPHPRVAGVRDRQVVPPGALRGRPGDRAASTWIDVRELALAERPKMIICGGTAIPRTIDFPAFAEIAAGGRRAAVRRHRAHRRPDRGRGAPVAGRLRRRHLHHHPQDAARPARRDAHGQVGARHRHRQGGLPRPAGWPAQPHHRRHRGRAARGGSAVVHRLRAPDRGQRQGAGRRP